MDAINSNPPEQSQIFDMWLETIMDDPLIQANGLSAIVDMEGYSWRLFRWFTPANIKFVAKKVDMYPFKELLLHIVNTSFLLSATIKLIWPFFNDRLKNMVSTETKYSYWRQYNYVFSIDIDFDLIREINYNTSLFMDNFYVRPKDFTTIFYYQYVTYY